MEQLKNMKQTLMNCVQGQLGDLKNTDTKELGEAIDMIKDLEEAMYYCSIVKAMEESEDKNKHMNYTYPPVMYNGNDMMHYDGGRMRGGRMYYDGDMRYPMYRMNYDSYPSEIRDYREGRSPMTRRNYMESKEMHQDKGKQMKELEQYMVELSQDIMEMINDATPEEKQILVQKLNTLAGKIH